jgi:hypothetical protein
MVHPMDAPSDASPISPNTARTSARVNVERGQTRAGHLKRLRISLGLLSLVVAAAAIAPSVSDAAVTTIGPATLTMGTENDSVAGTFIQYAGAGPATEYVSPIEGTIVTWRIASGSSGEVGLRVLRPAGEGGFTGVGTSATEVANPPLSTFATNLPIKAGDVIAVDNGNSALIFTTGVLGAFPEVFTPALVDGAPAAKPNPVTTGSSGGMELKLQINADIQPAVSSGSTGVTGSTGSTGVVGSGGSGSRGGNTGPTQPGPPTLAGLKVLPNALKKGTGATLSYTDSQPATTTFTVLQKQPGRRNKQGVCAKPPRRPRGRPCTLLVKIAIFTHSDSAGANSFHVTGRVNGRNLKPGSYQLQAAARNAGGLTSKVVATSFSVHK